MGKSSSTEEFIEKCKKSPKVKKNYDYSKVKYEKNYIKVNIGCLEPEHDFFAIRPRDFLRGKGCPICGGSKLSNTEEFIKKATNSSKVKKDYDYSQVIYEKAIIKVKIGCYNKEHGFFMITPNDFLNGGGCSKCKFEKLKKLYSSNTEDFIKKAISSDKVKKGYDYSKIRYINNKTKVEIGCYNKEHGFFCILPTNFLAGQGCAKCKPNKKTNTEEYLEKIKKSTKIKKQYDYSKIIYIDSDTKVEIGCEEHGFFKIDPTHFLQGQGCPVCAGNRISNSKEFIEKCKNNPKVKKGYDYSKVDYKTAIIKVKIGCYDLSHGYFEVTPHAFLAGNGCPKCIQGFGEYFVVLVFSILFNEVFIKSRPNWIVNPKTNRKLELDGYCEKLKLAVEYQGIQHEEIVAKFGMTQEDLVYGKYKDQIKREACKANGVLLIEVPQFGVNFSPKSLKDLIIQKCIEQNYLLPDNFDEIVIDVDQIEREFLEQKINKLRKKAKND